MKRGSKNRILVVFIFLIILSLAIFFILKLNHLHLAPPTLIEKTGLINENSLNLNNNVLVLYNVNANESLDIAKYYANARGIDPSRLCGIELPTGEYATMNELLGARKTIIENCICNTIPLETRPNPCNSSNINQIAADSQIIYLTIIRGIPPRLIDTGWGDDSDNPSFDFYLSRMIYQPDGSFNATTNGYMIYTPSSSNYFSLYQPSSSISGYIRPINISLDRILAYGRIDGVNKQQTEDLIDRTLKAEKEGITGNFLRDPQYRNANGTVSQSDSLIQFFEDLSSSRSSLCNDYLNSVNNPWPYESCRTGATAAFIPGESGTNIPIAVNAGIFLGELFDGDDTNEMAFNGFYNMLNWQKSPGNCTTLCKDFTNQSDINNCRANSTDYFKEINTMCVGGADDLMLWQLRSFPVGYMGFWPSVFGPLQGNNGGFPVTPPIVVEGNAFQNSRFSDNKYLHFGEDDQTSNPQCTLENGTVENCSEIIGLNLYYENYTQDVEPGQNTTYELIIRYRNPAQNYDPWVHVHFTCWNASLGPSSGLPAMCDYTDSLEVKNASTNWSTWSMNFSMNNSYPYPMTQLFIFVNTWGTSDNLRSWFDIDGIELINLNTSQELIDSDTGSFNAANIGYTYTGDWASNVIDRLGGIAAWGSSSHFLTGGWAFSNPGAFTGAFYSGRSLGESLAYNSQQGMSGIIYGDPLYRPAGVKIYLNNTSLTLYPSPGYIFESDPITYNTFPQININAFDGRSNLNVTKWSLSICQNISITNCDSNNGWSVVESGNSSVFEYPIKTNLSYLVQNLNFTTNFIMKLYVFNPGEENDSLANYAYFEYFAPPTIILQPSRTRLGNDQGKNILSNMLYVGTDYDTYYNATVTNRSVISYSMSLINKLYDSSWQINSLSLNLTIINETGAGGNISVCMPLKSSTNVYSECDYTTGCVPVGSFSLPPNPGSVILNLNPTAVSIFENSSKLGSAYFCLEKDNDVDNEFNNITDTVTFFGINKPNSPTLIVNYSIIQNTSSNSTNSNSNQGENNILSSSINNSNNSQTNSSLPINKNKEEQNQNITSGTNQSQGTKQTSYANLNDFIILSVIIIIVAIISFIIFLLLHTKSRRDEKYIPQIKLLDIETNE